MADYTSERGDLVWLTFHPQAGHERSGRRPALTLSPASYNGKVGLGLFCPITSQVKGYPFEVNLFDGLPITGVILADQVRSLDWQVRRAVFVARAPVDVVRSVLAKLNVLLDFESYE